MAVEQEAALAAGGTSRIVHDHGGELCNTELHAVIKARAALGYIAPHELHFGSPEQPGRYDYRSSKETDKHEQPGTAAGSLFDRARPLQSRVFGKVQLGLNRNRRGAEELRGWENAADLQRTPSRCGARA